METRSTKRKRESQVCLSLIKRKKLDWKEWVSATSTKNYSLKDPLLDWIKEHMFDFSQKNVEYTSCAKKMMFHKSRENFTQYIMERGKEFEEKVIGLLYKGCRKNIDESKIVDIGGDINARSCEKAKETIKHIKNFTPIIYSGVLHDHETKTYGVPDLIVRGDYLKFLVDENPLKDFEEKSKVYYIVDIKFTTLNLRSNGVNLLNSGSVPAYKSQLFIYNRALDRIQKKITNKAFLLGRKWLYKKGSEIFSGDSCFERLGEVNFSTVDESVKDSTKNAVKWILKMRKKGKDWNPYLNPNPVKELYPNMCNNYDFPYRFIKESISEKTRELTGLWNVGVKGRKIANKQGIYKWSDKKCTAKTLGITGNYTSNIISKILNINQSDKNLILPHKIKNNRKYWKEKKCVEFYVDFESVNDVITDFSKMPKVTGQNLTFMIGVGHRNIKGEWIYKNFITDKLSVDDEYKIFLEFTNYIRAEMLWRKCYNPLLVHWAHFEQSCWKKTIQKFKDKGYDTKIFCTVTNLIPLNTDINGKRKLIHFKDYTKKTIKPYALWLNLQKVFKEEPIVIKGCTGGFNLKEITKKMFNHGFIKTNYDSDNLCGNGTCAMLSALKASQDAKNKGISMKRVPIMKNIEKYNEIDCKVMMEIIEYLREKHI